MIVNRSPVASASVSQTTIGTGKSVSLDGSGSSDPEGDTLSYTWTVTGRPAGASTTISNSTSATASYTPDRAGSYTITLSVNDTVNSDTATVSVSATQYSVALVAGSTTGTTAEYQATIAGFGIYTDVILQANAAANYYTNYDAILVMDDATGTWDAADVNALVVAGLPIMGVGYGGTQFFDEVAADIGWLASMIDYHRGVIVRNGGSPIWSSPNNLSVVAGDTVQLLATNQTAVVWYNGNDTAYTNAIGGVSGTHEAIAEQTSPRLLQFGFRQSPTTFTTAGTLLLENLIFYLIAM